MRREVTRDHDTIKSRNSGVVAYKFQTAILGVNRAIHDEAEKLMYKRNVFILLSYQCEQRDMSHGGLLWLPVVSMKHVGWMQLHSLRIHHNFGSLQSRYIQLQSCIILADDLEAFCLAVRMSTAERVGAGVPLAFAPGRTIIGLYDDPEVGIYRRPDMKCLCDLRNTKHRPMDETFQHRLLTPLASMSCINQRVMIRGAVCNPSEVDHLKQLMSPSLICTEATVLHELQTLVIAKDIANAAVGHDELAFVLHLYEHIAGYLCMLMVQKEKILEAVPRSIDLVETMFFEVSINIGCGRLKLRDFDAVDDWFHNAGSMLDRLYERLGRGWEVPDGIRHYHHSLGIWRSLYCPDGIREASKVPHGTVAHEVGQFQICSRFPHQAYDLEILKRNPDQEAIVSAEHLPFDQCSISQLPFLATSFYKNVENLEEFTQSRGWHDIRCLKSLDDQTKTTINYVQKQHGGQVTDFSLFDIDFDKRDGTKKSR